MGLFILLIVALAFPPPARSVSDEVWGALQAKSLVNAYQVLPLSHE